MRRRRERLAITQGIFFAASGLWPIVSLRTFEKVTGPKPEGWLVQTVGGLITVVGATLVAAGSRRRVTPEIELLGAGSALALATVDVVFAGLRRRISPFYLLDAANELTIFGVWVAERQSQRTGGYARWWEMPQGWDFDRRHP